VASIDPKNLFGFLVQDIARLMSRTFENQQGPIKVTRTQARVLAYISQFEGATQSEIAALMDVQKITLTKLVDSLEEMNLIERRADPADRRIRRLHMAANAHPVLEDIWRRLSDVSDIALMVLPLQRRKAFIQDMISVRRHLIAENTPSSETTGRAPDRISSAEKKASNAGRKKQ